MLCCCLSYGLSGHSFSEQNDSSSFKHKLELGHAVHFQGSGDLYSQGLLVSYGYTFSSCLSTAVFVVNSHLSSFTDDGFFTSESIWTFDPVITIVPFVKKLDWFSVSVGPSFRSRKSVSGDGYQTFDNTQSSQQFGSFGSSNIYTDEFSVGATAMVNLRLFRKDHFLMVLHPVLQGGYTNGDIASGILVSAGLRF